MVHPSDFRPSVGVVGLGQMGLPVALRLLAAGYEVHGYRRREPPREFLQAGGKPADDPAEIAEACQVVLTLLPSEQVVAEVAAGERGLNRTTRRDGVWVEMSTLGEGAKLAAVGRLRDRGWGVLDCPISGAPPQLRAGTAVLFSSGNREVHDRVDGVLRAISPLVHHVGQFGFGMRAKYTAHLLLAGHNLVAAEALAFARKAGLDPADVLAMLSGSIVSSAVFDERGPSVLAPASAGARSQLEGFEEALIHLREYADHAGASTPVLKQVIDHLARLPRDAGGGLVASLFRLLSQPDAADGPTDLEGHQL